MEWGKYYPAYSDLHAEPHKDGFPVPLTKQITVADIGSGFGGLLVALSPMLPDELILGLEIRQQVTEFVQDRISALRAQHVSNVDNKTIVVPKHKVHDDRYVKLPEIPSGDSDDAKEYIIRSAIGLEQEHIENTESQIRAIIKAREIPTLYEREERITRWASRLSEAQFHAIEAIDCIDGVQENNLENHRSQGEDIVTLYYDTAKEIISPNPPPTPYSNISVLRANTMKFLPNFFHRAQLTHIFLCFPDPHFKARKHKARIVSSTLCAEYAYVLRPGGCVYTITDVEELGNWMWERFEEFGKEAGAPVFEKVEVPEEAKEGEWIEDLGDSEVARDRRDVAKMVRCIREETEEGKKVSRNKGNKFVSVWRRRENPKWPDEE